MVSGSVGAHELPRSHIGGDCVVHSIFVALHIHYGPALTIEIRFIAHYIPIHAAYLSRGCHPSILGVAKPDKIGRKAELPKNPEDGANGQHVEYLLYHERARRH